jgi:hypothetical protein
MPAISKPRGHINRKIREGMATETIEAAREWLETNAKCKVGSRSKSPPKPAALVLPVDGDSTLADAVERLQAGERERLPKRLIN